MTKGVFTALTTPFTPQGNLDIVNLQKLLTAQLNAGVDGIVLLGTTAEAATLTAAEKQQVLQTAVPMLKGKAKIIIGTGTNNTVTTLENTRAVKPFLPDAVLVVTPYYNKPNPSGLIAHYQAVAKEGLPIIMYHIPGRTGLKVPAAVLAQVLAQVPQIVGVKESDYDMAHVTDTAVRYSKKISYLCGNDDLFPHYLSINAAGIISAAGNVFAPAFVKIYNLFKSGKTAEAFDVFSAIYPLIKACYLETNPTCVKYMLFKLGFCTEKTRLPLGEISAENKTKIDNLLAQTDKTLFIQG